MIDRKLLCDIDQTPMNMTSDEQQVTFTCTKCDQQHFFDKATGRHTFLTLGKLFPSTMKEDSPVFQEFLDYRLKEVSFLAQARFLAELISEKQCLKEQRDIERLVAAKRTELESKRRK